VFYYSVDLFESAGLSRFAAHAATIGVGAEMVLMTLVSIPLMDRAGRRTLHLYGLGGMFIFSVFITISLLVRVSFPQFLLCVIIEMYPEIPERRAPGNLNAARKSRVRQMPANRNPADTKRPPCKKNAKTFHRGL
jgi:hypothetical protein